MTSALCLWIVLSHAILADAMPTISNRALRVPLQRRSRNTGDPTPVQSVTGERYLGAERVASLIDFAHQCVLCSLVILSTQPV